MDKKIIKLIERHHLLSLATLDSDGAPYCASAFYAFRSDAQAIIFSTDPTTRHGNNILNDNRASATIALETKVVGKIQGVQIVGTIIEAQEGDKLSYITKYPYAAAIPTLHLWRFEPTMIKLTDNKLGFGKKIIWSRE